MTATTAVLQDDGKTSWQLSKQLARRLLYGSLLFSLVVQVFAFLAQVFHLYQNHQPGMGFIHHLEVWVTVLLVPQGWITILIHFIIVKRNGVAKCWSWACAGEMADKPLWMRSARFHIGWCLFWLLGSYAIAIVNSTGPSTLTIIGDYLLTVAIFAANGLLLLKVSKWPRRYLACIVFCAASLLVDLFFIEKGLFMTSRLSNLPRDPSTEGIFKLAEQHTFDTSRIRTLNVDNAFYTSSIFSEVIGVGTSLIMRLGSDATVAVMAHELGHRTNRDILAIHAANLITDTLSNVLVFYLIIPNAEIFSMFGFESEPVIAALPIMDILGSVAKILFQPVYMARSIAFEYAADAYAVKLGHGKGLISFCKSSNVNKTASRIFEYVFLSHPSNEHRIAAIEARMNETLQGNP